MYDPEHDNLKKQPRKPVTDDEDHDELIVNLHQWREEVELVADEKLGAKFAEFWCGGKKHTLLQEQYGIAPGDSVEHVAAWLFDAVSGRFLTADAPVYELEDQWGYEFIDTMHGPGAIKKPTTESRGDAAEEYEEDELEKESSSPSEYSPSQAGSGSS